MYRAKKATAVILFLVLLCGCLAPAAAAADVPFAANGANEEATPVPQTDAPEDPAADPFIYEEPDEEEIIRRIQRMPALTTEADDGIDWDEVAEILLHVLYTGESADVRDLRIPYTEENKSRIYLIQALDPRFNVNYADTTAYCWIDGVKYYASFRSSPEQSGAFRAEYDACMDVIATLTRGLRDNDALSDVDKCLLLHDRLCAWAAYDYDRQATKNYAAFSAFQEHYCVCQGYANAYNWLLRSVGIRAEYVRSSTLGHGWSMVYLDGEPYYVDPTWDDPGRETPGFVRHTHFMTSFDTFSRNHRNATDFSDAPCSTIYEDYFCKQTDTEVVYAGGDLYYLTVSKDNRGCLFKRNPDGDDVEILSFPLIYTYTDEQGEEKIWNYSPRMTAIGDKILYPCLREVRAYDTVTGEDNTVYVPSQSIFTSPRYYLAGIRQRGGEVYIYANDAFHTNGLQPDHDTFMDAHSETFQFCTHPNRTLLKRLPGESCSAVGDGKYLCEDCGAILLEPGEGVPGAHDFSVEAVTNDTFFRPATCVSGAQYRYTCSVCGAIEDNGAHLFYAGEPDPHDFVSTAAPATAARPGYTENVCRACGAVEYADFTFAENAVACGVLEGFGWQIVNGLLSVTGNGDMPDYSAENRPPWYAYRADVTAAAVSGAVTAIGAYAFSDMGAMQAISLPGSVASFGAFAFARTGLASIGLPDALEIIGDSCFRGAASLGSVGNNARLASIGAYAFADCVSLISVVIPGTVGQIGNGAFNACSGLTTLTVEAGELYSLPAITDTACRSLTDVYVPYTLESFQSAPACVRFIVAPENEALASVDGVVFSKDLKKLIIYPARGSAVYYRAPAATESLSGRAFDNVENLRFLDLSDTHVKQLYSIWFRSKQSDLHVNLPETLTLIDDMTLSFTNAVKLFVPASVRVENRTNNKIKVPLYTNSADAPIKAFCDERGISCTVLEGHVHSFTETAYSEATGCGGGLVIKVCECGQFSAEEQPAGHTPGEPVETVIRAATCSVRGEKSVVVKCAACGETLSETTVSVDPDPDNHADYGTKVINAVPATCHSDGYTGDTVCARCEALFASGEVISGDTVPHAWDEGTVTLKPTCKTAGKMLYRCTAAGCGAAKEETINMDPNAHVYNVTVAEPTCTEAGYTTHVCTLCGYAYKDNETAPLGHSYAIRVTPATCTAGGYTTCTCTRCRDSFTKDPTPPVDHVDADGDGKCDFGCGTVFAKPDDGGNNAGAKCPFCGQTHTGPFGGIIAFFHRIAYFFTHLFGR